MMEQTDKIDTLIEQVEFLSKKLFGSSSEKTKVDPGQLTLFGDPVLEEPLTKDEPTEEITYRRRKTSGRKAELTKDLPIEEVHCELHGEDCTCDHCGQAMKPMGKKVVREEVCFVPARLYKKVYISHAYECDCHDPNLEGDNLLHCSHLNHIIHQKPQEVEGNISSGRIKSFSFGRNPFDRFRPVSLPAPARYHSPAADWCGRCPGRISSD